MKWNDDVFRLAKEAEEWDRKVRPFLEVEQSTGQGIATMISDLSKASHAVEEFNRRALCHPLSISAQTLIDQISEDALSLGRISNLAIETAAQVSAAKELIGASIKAPWEDWIKAMRAPVFDSAALGDSLASHCRQISELSSVASTQMAGIRISEMVEQATAPLRRLADDTRALVASYESLAAPFLKTPALMTDLPRFVSLLPAVEVAIGARALRSISGAWSEESDETESATIPIQEEESLEDILGRMRPEWAQMWRGANGARRSANPDGIRHVSVSLRELCIAVLNFLAPEKQVLLWLPDTTLLHNRKPNRRAQLLFLCRNFEVRALPEFVAFDLDSAVSLFSVFNRGTHGHGDWTEYQVDSVIGRAENLLRFLIKLGNESSNRTSERVN
jgi:hypothetical protein